MTTDALSTNYPTRKTTEMTLNGAPKVTLIQEVLSRARMRQPQTSEARRSARRVAMEARHRAARELGGRPF